MFMNCYLVSCALTKCVIKAKGLDIFNMKTFELTTGL